MMNNAEVMELLVRVDERLERTEADVKELLHCVRGNGKPGLESRVAVLEAAGTNAWQRRGIYATLVAAVVGAFVELFRSLS